MIYSSALHRVSPGFAAVKAELEIFKGLSFGVGEIYRSV
jgi:hypothetical protein